MWRPLLWIVALCSPLPALCGVEHGSPGVSNGSTQGAPDTFPGNHKTSLEIGTSRTGTAQNQSGPADRKWGPSTAPLLPTPVQSSTNYKAGGEVAPTITVLAENGSCNVLLTCALAGGAEGEVAFSWQSAHDGEVLSRGPRLRITQRPPQGTLDFVCTVHSKGAHGSSQVSLREHCGEDPPITGKRVSASFYAKYTVPIVVVLLVLAALFLMYRRKRGREIHSSMVSINESSDSDNEARSAVDQAAEASFLPQAFKLLNPEDVDIPEATATVANPDTPDSPEEPPSQA